MANPPEGSEDSGTPEPSAKPPLPSRVQIHLPADLEPIYSNFAMITNSPSEIVVDFAQIMPQVPQARVRSRVVMTPLNAKLVLRALTEHLARYEAHYGEILVPPGGSLAEQLFRPPPTEARDRPPGGPEGEAK
ncbi:MAG TPA: DUF3467 domain-containing protein [Anaerolineales bacterium]|nr:DUF3467 domain-containing protein [Anaerolineales bacterium]